MNTLASLWSTSTVRETALFQLSSRQTSTLIESGAQLTRFETGRPVSKRVKGCESGRNLYTCDGAGFVFIRSLRTALDLLKEEEKDEQFTWAAISVYHFRNVCQLRQRYFHTQNNRLINPRCLDSRETIKRRRSATAPRESPS